MKSHEVKALIAACADYYTATAKALKEDGELLKAGSSMPLSENKPRSSESANDLEVINRNKEGDFLVKHHQTGSICTIVDTFAEMFTAMEISPARPHFSVFYG